MNNINTTLINLENSIRTDVDKYIAAHTHELFGHLHSLKYEDIDHIKYCLCQVLVRRLVKYPHSPGSFVKAILDNDLMATYGYADDINKKAIPVYVQVIYNIGYSRETIELSNQFNTLLAEGEKESTNRDSVTIKTIRYEHFQTVSSLR